MKPNRFILPISSLLIILFITIGLQPSVSAEPAEKIRVLLTYQPGSKSMVKRALENAGGEFHYTFDELETFAITLPISALEGISRSAHVIYIEEDPIRYIGSQLPDVLQHNVTSTLRNNPYEEQVVPYGIDMVQARDVWDQDRNGVIDPGAPSGAGITICIIDSGLYTSHEDLIGVNVVGGWPTTGPNPWNADGLGHGTHVAGTIAAMNNDIGVVGVTPGTVDLYIVRVFGNDGRWVNASSLINAANQCSNTGANIISMSLSGSTASTQEELAFNNLYNAGILSIAAASNEGTSAYRYPASYASVISVGALDASMTWANFSNFNNQVELSAPGVAVLSTVPFTEINSVTVDGTVYAGNHIEYSTRGSATGELVNGGLCGSAGAWSGKVVLCERGTNSFYNKVINVQNGGGLAALIYNNEPGNFFGTLGDGNTAAIIGLSLSQQDGQLLIANKLAFPAAVTSQPRITGSGYEAWYGTSMATPHVSGAAALVWSCLPSATNAQVRDALTSTALDLGASGRDVYYGFGLVQAKDACNYLNPTSVHLHSFTASSELGSIVLRWQTTNEIDNLGFNLYRGLSDNTENRTLMGFIQSLSPPGSVDGSDYEFIDQAVEPGMRYYYWLEAINLSGRTSRTYDPITVIARSSINPIFLPLFFGDEY